MSDTQNELSPCVRTTAWDIIITCDCCGSCSVELHLHKDGLYVTNACSQDFLLTCPITQASRWQVKRFDWFLRGLTGGRGWSQNNHIKVLKKKEYFYPALCIKQRAFYSLMCHFKLRSALSLHLSPRLCNTLNIALQTLNLQFSETKFYSILIV